VEPLLSDAGLPPVWAVDVDQDRYGLVEAFHLSVLPTLILQRDGNLLARLEGTRTLEQIKDMVNQ
jgi:thioredoxin-like negative regulator of GroEL